MTKEEESKQEMPDQQFLEVLVGNLEDRKVDISIDYVPEVDNPREQSDRCCTY